MRRSPQEVMGHAGHHGGKLMDAMVRDMRHRFLVAAVLSVLIRMWLPIGRDVVGLAGLPSVPGARDDVLALLLRLPSAD
jgi:Cu2+-exporting ATPase